MRDELAKVAIFSLMEGFINEASILEVAPSIISKPLTGLITLLNEYVFFVLLKSPQEVKKVSKLGSFKVVTKDDPYTTMLSPWSTELEADGRALG